MSSMSIREKWAFFFHNRLQNESQLDQCTAREALALIDWMFDKYLKFHRDQGYAVPKIVEVETNAVREALESKRKGAAARQQWPSEILDRWRNEQPFHESVGNKLLDSDWEPLWRLQQRKDTGESDDG